MWQRRGLLAGVLAAVVTAFPTIARALPDPTAAQVRPHSFAGCSALVSYARGHFARTRGLPDPPIVPQLAQPAAAGPTARGASPVPSTAAPSADGGGGGTTYSTTNDQEPGVDEADIVKTDGSTIFTISQNTLYAVSVGHGVPRLAGSLDLGASGFGAQLLLRGNRLIVISSQAQVVPLPAAGGPVGPAIAASPYYAFGGQTVLTEVDVHDPSAMAVTQTLTIDGRFVDARQSGSSARVVISSAPRAILDPALAAGSSGWVPSSRFQDSRTGRRFTRPIARCAAIRRPVEFSGLGMLTIVTIDFDRGLGAAHSEALMADAQVVYGSLTSLYVATQRWIDPTTPIPQLPFAQTTVIDRFDVTDPDTTTLVASGAVPGYLLNQFSLSEYGGYLRVATTSRPIWWGAAPPQSLSQSYVTVLASQSGRLVPVGQVSGLGAGEQIYSVRFVGDTGYVVTFRQVDPLYTIDLSTPSAPRVAGQLELEGYSAYLHPLGDGLLLGIGADVGAADNEPSGTQLELFDVSNPAAPKLLQRLTLGGGSSSQAQYDHHAFLYWPPSKLAVLPVQIYPFSTSGPSNGGVEPFTGAIGFRVSPSGMSELGRIVQDQVNGVTPAILRELVIGDQLFTISDRGVLASSLDTLSRESFLALPVPQPLPLPAPLPTPRPVPLPAPAPLPGALPTAR